MQLACVQLIAPLQKIHVVTTADEHLCFSVDNTSSSILSHISYFKLNMYVSYHKVTSQISFSEPWMQTLFHSSSGPLNMQVVHLRFLMAFHCGSRIEESKSAQLPCQTSASSFAAAIVNYVPLTSPKTSPTTS